MRFLNPALFTTWAWLLLVPIILYLFRPRPKTIRTSTLPFFKWLAKEHQESNWLRKLKHFLSLLLSLFVLLGGAAALGRLVMSPPNDALKSVVILVDRSASMSAENANGVPRIVEALKRLQARVDGLPAGVGVIVMTYDQRPEVLLSRTVDRRPIQRTLQSIKVRDMEDRPEIALQLANRLAQLEQPSAIWLATDTPPTSTSAKEKTDSKNKGEEKTAEANIPVELLNVALAEPVNVGITALNLRRLPQERNRFEIFVKVSSSAAEEIEAKVDVKLDGEIVQYREMTIPPRSSVRHLIAIDAEGVDKRLTLSVTAEGDTFSQDNLVAARLPKAEEIRVLWITKNPDPLTERALQALDTVSVLQGPPSVWPVDRKFDLVIFDEWLPNKWPEDLPAIVVNPPQSVGPIQAVSLSGNGLPVTQLRVTAPDHPLLYGIASGRLSLTQTAVVNANGPLQPLWVSERGPLLLAGEFEGKRLAVLSFSPSRAEMFQLTASFPLFIGNLIYWAGQEQLEASAGKNLRTGEIVQLEGKTLTWTQPDDAESAAETINLQSSAYELDRQGLWETETGEQGSAALLSTRESLLPSRSESSTDNEQETSSWFRGDLVPVLLSGLVILLLLESWLFHRHSVY